MWTPPAGANDPSSVDLLLQLRRVRWGTTAMPLDNAARPRKQANKILLDLCNDPRVRRRKEILVIRAAGMYPDDVIVEVDADGERETRLDGKLSREIDSPG
ncbi:MAG: hypothetical protein LC753_19495 [Acidobacteria bacterium]|nr:hypothetical protein [Acidobacteriota bacterium]